VPAGRGDRASAARARVGAPRLRVVPAEGRDRGARRARVGGADGGWKMASRRRRAGVERAALSAAGALGGAPVERGFSRYCEDGEPTREPAAARAAGLPARRADRLAMRPARVARGRPPARAAAPAAPPAGRAGRLRRAAGRSRSARPRPGGECAPGDRDPKEDPMCETSRLRSADPVAGDGRLPAARGVAAPRALRARPAHPLAVGSGRDGAAG
jgi:hypothetical protein